MKPACFKVYKFIFLPVLLLSTVPLFAQSTTTVFSVSGLKVILKQTQKETLVMSMYYRGGVTNYTSADAGIESLALSGAISCGNNVYTASNFNDQRDEYGVHLYADAANDYGVIKLSCITMYAEEGWKLFASAITSPVFSEQKFDMLKQDKIDELRTGLSRPDTRVRRLASEFAFAGTPYASNPEGSVENISRFARDVVKDYYYNTLLNKRKMFLVVAGNISKEDLERKVQNSFAAIPEKEYTPVNLADIKFAKDGYRVESRPLATNYICGILNAPDLTHPDYPAYKIGITLLNSIMFREIRLTKRLSYAPAAGIVRGRISYSIISASTARPQQTVKAMYEIISEIKSSVYTDETVTELKKSQLLSYIKQQEVMSDIVDALGEAEVMGDWQFAENFNERVRSVTAREIQNVLKNYFKGIEWAYIGDSALAEESFTR